MFLLVLSLVFPARLPGAERGESMRLYAVSVPRIALVIGNDAYRSTPLQTAKNDAGDVASALKEVGFEVKRLEDTGLREMRRALRDFGRRLRSGESIGLFYFSGHAIQVGGRNYLLAVDAEIRESLDVAGKAIALEHVLRLMGEAKNAAHVVVLDACRRNSLVRRLGRSASEGLAPVKAPPGVVVAFAAGPGSVVPETTGRNSPYTAQLLANLRAPGLSITQWLHQTQGDVIALSAGRQVPWLHASLRGDVALREVDTRPVAKAAEKVASVSAPAVGPATQSIRPVVPEVIWLRGGCFDMGSPKSEMGRYYDEERHKVCVESFGIAKHEVTFEEYERFARAKGRSEPGDQGWGRGRQPVIGVSWEDATAYAQWLSEHTGKRYRLPTEAEWEFAARAGTNTPYWWGGEVGRKRAICTGCGSGRENKGPAPVGSFPPNPYGLHDTAGNVSEWTCSVYDRDYGEASGACEEENAVRSRTIRGGSWYDGPRGIRSARRDRGAPDLRFFTLGFRLARDPEG